MTSFSESGPFFGGSINSVSTNPTERGEQVRLRRQISAKSSELFVWLGSGSEESTLAWEAMDRAAYVLYKKLWRFTSVSAVLRRVLRERLSEAGYISMRRSLSLVQETLLLRYVGAAGDCSIPNSTKLSRNAKKHQSYRCGLRVQRSL